MSASTPVVFACIGDSITLNAPIRAERPWSATLDLLLFPGAGTANRGKNSTITSEWLTRYTATIKGKGFWGVTVLPTGFNDIDTSVPAADAYANSNAIVSDALSDGLRVIYGTPLPASGAAGWNGTKQSEIEALRALVLARGAHPFLRVLDLYASFGLAGDPTRLDPAWQGPDLDDIHIGQAGGDRMAALVQAAIIQLLP